MRFFVLVLAIVISIPAEAARLFAQAPPAERLASGADVAEAAERLLLQVRLAVDAAGGIDWHIGMPSAVCTAALVLCEAAVGKDTTPQQLLAHRNLTLGTAQLNPGSAQLEALSLLLPRMRDLRSIELTAGASTSTVAKRQLAALLRAREPPITSFGCGRWHFTEPSGALTLRGLDSPDVELLAALVRGAPALSSLSLPDCSADVDAGAQLLGALQAHGGIEELSGVPLARLSRDEVAELAGDGLSDVEVVALAAVLPQAVSLRAIDLSGGRISARAAALLGAALSTTQAARPSGSTQCGCQSPKSAPRRSSWWPSCPRGGSVPRISHWLQPCCRRTQDCTHSVCGPIRSAHRSHGHGKSKWVRTTKAERLTWAEWRPSGARSPS